jgi:PAS domain S-box-containing protein
VSPEGRQTLRELAIAMKTSLARGFLESEEHFRQIAEALHDIVALNDQRMTQLYFVNSAYERIWGRPREDLYVDPMAFLEGVHPDDRERVRDAIRRQGFDVEFRVVRPDGDQRWVWSRGFPVRNANGEVYRVASITEDITDRVRIVESRERLVRGFTHDVNNPLGAADGYLSLLADGMFGPLSAAQMEHLERARRSIRTAFDLVARLLEIERAEAGHLEVERVRMDLGAAMHETVEGFRAQAFAKGLSLTILEPASEEPLIIESDPARVRQIIANLISNAVKYTQPGGAVEVRAYVTGGTEGPRHGCWAAVTVADDGPGIPLEKQNLLFREFTRFDPGAADGSGIGLAFSQHLARGLGATITFLSRPAAGSSFTAWFPIDPPAGGCDDDCGPNPES